VRFRSALEAALAYGRTAFFAALVPPDEEPKKAAIRKKKRLSALDQDQRRLEGLAAQQLYGEAVAANLSALDPKVKHGPMELSHPEQGLIAVPMDPALTILENMERFFRKAAKGRRGQQHVERLRREAEEGLPAPVRQKQTPREAQGQAKAARPGQSGQSGRGSSIPLHRFRSDDGFTILRGKNSAANHKLLSELASPFDYWLHAEGGPGAHVIVKRDHPGQEIPESTLVQAAVLAGLSSWRAGDSKANVLYAQAREVRKMKGAALGQVRLDSAKTLLVDLDPSLEDRLRIES
jgi:predicted ribosome quality control (RQC) complex YloA/Tae2 family protein